MVGRLASAATAALLALSPWPAEAAPVVISGPIADPIEGEGTGLCAASAVSSTPANDFSMNTSAYADSINSFMDKHTQDRVEATLRTLLDLSNNNQAGGNKSYGDFTAAMTPECKTGGCDFFINDDQTSFASRLRGYLNVTAELAGKPIHLGAYADDAVSVTLFGKNGAIYPVITSPPELGVPARRVTNTVTFEQPGLYPIEILYAEIVDHAALEVSLFEGTFTDINQAASGPTNLETAGFKLLGAVSFFQTLSGGPSFPDVDQCKQCERQFVNLPGNNGCIPGYYCNESALCSPCDSSLLCGPACAPCGGDTPFCVDINGNKECGGCRTDYDCKEGSHCDADTHECIPCDGSSECPGGGGGGGGGGGSGGGAGASTSGGSAQDPGDDTGCGCRITGSEPRSATSLAAFLALAALLGVRRRRTGAR